MSHRPWFRSRWFAAVGVVAVVLLAVVLLYFEPQTALFDDEASDALPAGATVSTGTAFASLDHDTAGTVLIVTTADGERQLRFEGLDTTNGPDLHVYLSANPPAGDEDAFDDGFFDLGELKGNLGDQNYAIPSDVDLGMFSSVVIWCDRFDAAFGAAPLPA